MIAERIYQYIVDREINQARIARKIGMSRQALCNKLQGRSAITVEEYFALCRALKVGLDEFSDSTQKDQVA